VGVLLEPPPEPDPPPGAVPEVDEEPEEEEPPLHPARTRPREQRATRSNREGADLALKKERREEGES